MLDSNKIPKFKTQMTIPPVFAPVEREGKNGVEEYYVVEACAFDQQMLPEGFPKTRVFGYGGMCKEENRKERVYRQCTPGPSFYMRRGVPAVVEWNNVIHDWNLFHVDPTIGWANPLLLEGKDTLDKQYKARFPTPTVTHLHGGEIPPIYDGHPEAWRTCDDIRGKKYTTSDYVYLNRQPSCSLWYHDHTYGMVRLNVYAGLAGAYIIRDEKNPLDRLNNALIPSGAYDVPLIIQDKSFEEDGSLYYPSVGDVPEVHPFWVPQFYGNTVVVNGVVWPNMNVEQNRYRFRILNASNTRKYRIHLSNDMEMIQIATDGGYLEEPVGLKEFQLAPAERIEVLIDFSSYKVGDKIVLQNLDEMGKVDETDQIMQFTVVPTPVKKLYEVPFALNEFPVLRADSSPVYTTILEQMDDQGEMLGMLMDGQSFQNPPSVYTVLGTTFYWAFVNLAMDSHPMHLHLVQFLVKQRQKIDVDGYLREWREKNGEQLPLSNREKMVDARKYFVGEPIMPEEYEMGWKDTVDCPVGYITVVLVRYAPIDYMGKDSKPFVNLYPFDPTVGPGYVYHCHLLEHEDNDMMRQQFVIGSNDISLF